MKFLLGVTMGVVLGTLTLVGTVAGFIAGVALGLKGLDEAKSGKSDTGSVPVEYRGMSDRPSTETEIPVT